MGNKAYNTCVDRIEVWTDGSETPFLIPAHLFIPFVEWFAEQRGVSVQEAEDILKNE